MDYWIPDWLSIILPVLMALMSSIIGVLINRRSKQLSEMQSKFSEEMISKEKRTAENEENQIKYFINYHKSNDNEKIHSDEYMKIFEEFLNEKYQKQATENSTFDNKIEELIQSHHEEAINQSKIQFWFSLVASVIGFALIIVIIFVYKDLAWYEYIIKMLPGAIIEAVSVLFFSQSKQTRERASDFLNRLRQDRQYTKSIALANTIEDNKLRSFLKAEIALNLCEIKDSDFLLKLINTKKE